MKKFREDLLERSLKATYYRGIFSDKFSVYINGKELLVTSWDTKNDKKLLGIEETFSFFLKACKLIL